jgi:hypothetical protein
MTENPLPGDSLISTVISTEIATTSNHKEGILLQMTRPVSTGIFMVEDLMKVIPKRFKNPGKVEILTILLQRTIETWNQKMMTKDCFTLKEDPTMIETVTQISPLIETITILFHPVGNPLSWIVLLWMDRVVNKVILIGILKMESD